MHTIRHPVLSSVTKDDKAINFLERDRWQDKQVDRRNAIRMIVQKGPPALRRRQPAASHIPSNRRLSDLEAELEKLTMNAWRAPEMVGATHLANGRAQLSRDIRAANTVARPQAQYTRNPARCHRMIVSGLTIAIAPRMEGKPAIEPNKQKSARNVLGGRAV